MFKFSPYPQIPSEHRKDAYRIQEALMSEDHDCSIWEAYSMWQSYSDSCSAGWIILPETNDEIRDILIERYDD